MDREANASILELDFSTLFLEFVTPVTVRLPRRRQVKDAPRSLHSPLTEPREGDPKSFFAVMTN